MNVGSLFSGVGGLDLGLARAGFNHAFFCESDPWRRQVLERHWPGVPIYDDVRDMGDQCRRGQTGSGDPFGERCRSADPAQRNDVHAEEGEAPHGGVDLICGGFPCQDVSVAGQRRGLAGNRTGLFFDCARIIDAVRPRWVLLENVPGLLSSNGGRDFGVVLGTLADIGYGLAWRVVDSRFFGVPQRRRRVFIVGAVADGDPAAAAAARAGEVLAVGTRCPRHPATRRETRQDVAVASLSGLGSGGPDDNDGQKGRLIAPALVKRYGKGADSDATDAMVAHSLTSAGFDASEDGTGRGTPLVAAPLTKGSSSGDGVNPPGRRQEDDVNIVATITLASDPISAENLAQPSTKRNGDPGVVVGADVGVRRLMPVECERLQGFPDDWTQLGGTKDAPRYSAMGDAVTVSVAEWIGQRMMRTDDVGARG